MSLQPEQSRGTDGKPDLDRIIAELRDLRTLSQKMRYRGGPLPELPSREAMIGIVDNLIAVLYPRHFGPAGLAVESIDGFIAYTLDTTLQPLREQVRRELQLLSNDGDKSRTEHERLAATITCEFAERLPKTRALLDTDIKAAHEGDPAARSLDEVVSCYPGIGAVMRHRIAHQLYLLGAPMLARIISEIAHAQTGIDIHPGADIGGSFFIDHGTGVVIGETAVIGRNVRLYQAVTLGAKRFEVDENGVLIKGKPRHPIIEDDVVIYAGATILGRVTIGRGSTIGGNVWLTYSVPPGSHIAQGKVRSDTFDEGSGI